MKLSESEQREIEDAAIFQFGDVPNGVVGYIAGATAMAEKKNVEIERLHKEIELRDEMLENFEAQLEAAQVEIEKLKEWREINMQDVANTVLGNEIFQQQLKAKDTELERVKEVAEKMARALNEGNSEHPNFELINEVRIEYANLMNKEKDIKLNL